MMMTTESLQIPRGKHKASNPWAVGITYENNAGAIVEEQKPVMYRMYGMPILQEQKIGVITPPEEAKRGHYCFTLTCTEPAGQSLLK